VKTTARLSAEERREALIRTARRVFAEKGFHGTTTRELAEEAGVSEALLFKHFPTKEALYSALHQPCADDPAAAEGKRLLGLEESTSTLVLLVHFLVAKLVLGHKGGGEDPCLLHRLMLRSLMEDGEFARSLLDRLGSCWAAKLQGCLKAAAETGDLADVPVAHHLRAWFVHHLAVMMMLHLRPATPAVDYRVSRKLLVEQAVWFSLRGLGLKDEAIRRYYNPQALALFSP
jgi:AcrR family transcriptional regulator